MTPEQRAALLLLASADRLFFPDYATRLIHGQCVMHGWARCYVVIGGEEWIRITDDGRRML